MQNSSLSDRKIGLQQVANLFFWFVAMSWLKTWWKAVTCGVNPFTICYIWLPFTAQVGACLYLSAACLHPSFHRESSPSLFYELPVAVTHPHFKLLLPLCFSGHGFSSLTVSQGDVVLYMGNSTLPSFRASKICNVACKAVSVPS